MAGGGRVDENCGGDSGKECHATGRGRGMGFRGPAGVRE